MEFLFQFVSAVLYRVPLTISSLHLRVSLRIPSRVFFRNAPRASPEIFPAFISGFMQETPEISFSDFPGMLLSEFLTGCLPKLSKFSQGFLEEKFRDGFPIDCPRIFAKVFPGISKEFCGIFLQVLLPEFP